MAIRVYNNKIMIGDYTLEEGPGGLVFTGRIEAESFVREGTFQGKVAGFNSGGWAVGPASNVIDRFPFATSTIATLDHGDLTLARFGSGTFSSDLHGYTAGGYSPSPVAGSVNIIDKFQFVIASNASDVGDLSQVVYTGGGSSSKQFGCGFSSGSTIPTASNIIERIPFSTDVNSFDAGDLSVARGLQAGQSAENSAYNSGGELVNGNPGVNTIDKFPMAATSYALATDVGDLTVARGRTTGQSSITHGYTSGGSIAWPSNSFTAAIDKFPFSSDSNASSVGNLTQARAYGSGTSSQEYGYYGAGATGTGSTVSTVERFSFAVDSNATSVGNLSVSRGYVTGTQI